MFEEVSIILGIHFKGLFESLLKATHRISWATWASLCLQKKFCSWINPRKIKVSFRPPPTSTTLLQEGCSRWVQRMFVFHMSVHSWVAKVRLFANLTLEVSSSGFVARPSFRASQRSAWATLVILISKISEVLVHRVLIILTLNI